MNMKKWLGWLTAVSIGLSVGTANATIIANWKFEGTGSTFTSDSSGNGNHLTNNGVTPSTDAPQGLSSSAYFNNSGGSTAGFVTTSNLNLSPYREIYLGWYVKSTDTRTDRILWEHGFNFSFIQGGIAAYFNSTPISDHPGTLDGAAGVHTHAGVGGEWNLDRLPYTASGEWTLYQVGINLDAALVADVVKLWTNGVAIADAHYADNQNKMPPPGMTFANAPFYIGSRTGNGTFGITGNIANLIIATTFEESIPLLTIPEPSTVFLLLTGVGILLHARKKR